MASNRDLFGDDDSDDDDDNNNENKDVVMADASTTAAVVVAAPNTSTTDAPLNEDEDDDEKQSKMNTSMDNKQNDDGDDDEDDDDDDAPQFDAQDVVGTKSTKRIDTHTPDFDSNNINNNSEELSTDKASATPKVIPVHPTLILPDTFSKFPSDVRNVDTVKYFTKLPNLMGIQTMGFSKETYAPDMEEELYQQAAYNLIRWRYKIDPVTKQLMRQKKNHTESHESKEGHEEDDDNDDGLSLVRESNTRLVEWEDGSHTLHIGSECFHVDFVDSSIQTTNPTNPNMTTSFPGLNGYLYLSQNATYQAPNEDNDGDNDNHPAMIPKATKKETILQSMGSIQQRMILRPSSLQSEAHKSLTVGIRQKTIKKARIAEVVTQEDPELIKQQKMKLSQDLEKTNLRKRSSGGGGGGGMYGTSRGSGYSGSSSSRPRMSKGYLEEDEDYDTTNLKDMKRRTMNRYDDDDDDDMRDYGDDDDDDDDDDDIATRNKGRPSRRSVVGSSANAESTKTTGNGSSSKNVKSGQPKKDDDDDDDDDVFGDDDDDDEDDIQLKTKSQKKKLHQAVIDDDDDDE